MIVEKNKIFVTVIIPVYNAEKFLVETIESVLNQSLKEFELILINDGSVDDSASICEEYQNNDSRIQYFSQANSGVSIARNLGLSKAIGEYIFFMDSDDTIDREFLKTSYVAAKEQNNDITIIGEEFCKRLPHAPALPTWAQLLRLGFLEKYSDIKFPAGIQPCEDGLFSHQLIALTENIGTNTKGIYHYRHHEDQNHLTINKNSDKVIQQIPAWLQILDNFYERYQLYKTKALHLALFIEHEPFEFRYLEMPLDSQQKFFYIVLSKTIC
ncbi:glycosyltransferase family 2 protein [Chryseobacterium sp. CH21]|uniref:glycosyltransferase family 2 protein n=2 Tax=unclassified Chryseobacterium TaxID=2593645 RepID=UPI001E3179E6|nr:glycosyltransferase family 2 protein [Chryseobacterium sp. CH21]